MAVKADDYTDHIWIPLDEAARRLSMGATKFTDSIRYDKQFTDMHVEKLNGYFSANLLQEFGDKYM